MNLEIRSNDEVTKVIVQDKRTGYAVAEFFYQSGADRIPLYDARMMADAFIKLIQENTSWVEK